MSETKNIRKLSKAFIEQRSEVEGRFLVITEKYPALVEQGLYYINMWYKVLDPIIVLRFIKERAEGVKNELFIAQYGIETKDFVEFINEVSDYIESLLDVKITAFSINNSDADVYIRIKGLKYPFRYYYNTLKIYENKNVVIRGRFRRFALFSEHPEVRELANKIVEIQKRLKNEYDELENLYYMLSYDTRSSIISKYDLRMLEKLVQRLTTVYDNVVIPETGMYIIQGSPQTTYRLYEKTENLILSLIKECKKALLRERLGVSNI